MMRNITKHNLEKIWKQLDDACGSIDNALTNINSIGRMPKYIKNRADYIDFSAIVSLKNEIEVMIEDM